MTDQLEYRESSPEISGFGGGYERTCRNMVIAGFKWLQANPEADPQFHGYKGIYGLITEDNADAKALTTAVLAAADGDATGAMHQATITHCMQIKRNGWTWEQYLDEFERPKP